ncbi:MAG: PAS domain S-box protein [Desulfosoma sp.]
MRRVSLRTKIFAALVVVSVVTLATSGAFLFRYGGRLLRLKSADELATASAAVAHFVDHGLEDALRDAESCLLALLPGLDGHGTGPEAKTVEDPNFKASFQEAGRAFLQSFPWAKAVALRDSRGEILVAYGKEDTLSPTVTACDAMPLSPRGCLVKGPESSDGKAAFMEMGLSRLGSGRALRCSVTFSVDVALLTVSAPVPEKFFKDTVVVLGRPGRADGVLLKESDWLDETLGEELTHRLGQRFLSGRQDSAGPWKLHGRTLLVASTSLPKLRWPMALAYPAEKAGMPSSALLTAMAGAWGLGLAFSLLVSWYAAASLVRPILRLREAFREFSQGRWDVRVPVTSRDEIGELTDGFNEGVAFLNTQHRKLKRFQTLVHHAQDAVLLCSPKGTLVYANRSAYDFFGFEGREETVLARLHERVCPAERGRFEKTIWPRMLEGPWEGEIQFCRRDGRTRVGWVRTGGVPGEEGEPNLVYAIVRDISERKAAEKAVRDAEEYYRTLFRTSRDAIVVTDPSDTIVDVNEPGFPSIFGYQRHEVLGRSVTELMAEASPEGVPETVRYPVATGRGTLKWRRKDGTVFAGETTVDALKGGKDEVRGTVRVIRDVSEREAFLEKLEKAYRDLKSLDELKDKFLAGVSHDLRTPLIPVRAFLEKLIQGRWGPLTPRQEEFLRYCLIGVSREMILVEELLDYTRLKSGSLSLRTERVDLQDIIRASLFLLKILAETNRLTVAVDMPVDPVPVLGDYNKLLRIFHNLFSNAVKYNRPGGHVTVRGSWQGPERFRVAVEDSGIGIPQESLRRIFDDFFRVEGAGVEARGSGIGLAVVRELVRLHGAELDVQSTLGVGSVFAVTFPVITEKNADEAG